jgi:hypothetical protein
MEWLDRVDRWLNKLNEFYGFTRGAEKATCLVCNTSIVPITPDMVFELTTSELGIPTSCVNSLAALNPELLYKPSVASRCFSCSCYVCGLCRELNRKNSGEKCPKCSGMAWTQVPYVGKNLALKHGLISSWP